MISLIIEAAGEGTDNTVLTLEGLEPNKTYYKYEDDFGGESAFVSDGNGRIPCPSAVNPPTGAPSEEHHCPQEPNRLHH